MYRHACQRAAVPLATPTATGFPAGMLSVPDVCKAPFPLVTFFLVRAQVLQVRSSIGRWRTLEMRDVIKLCSLLLSHTDLNPRDERRDPGVSSCSASRQWKWLVGPDWVTDTNEIRTFTVRRAGLWLAIFLLRGPLLRPQSSCGRAERYLLKSGLTSRDRWSCRARCAVHFPIWTDAFSHSWSCLEASFFPSPGHSGWCGWMKVCCVLLLQHQTVSRYCFDWF